MNTKQKKNPIQLSAYMPIYNPINIILRKNETITYFDDLFQKGKKPI